MKGYFSHLARHTGLRYQSGKALNAALASVTADPREEAAVRAPLHVEEITFTRASSMPAAAVSETSKQGRFDLNAPIGRAGDAAERLAEGREADRWGGAAQAAAATIIHRSHRDPLERAQVRYAPPESEAGKPQTRLEKEQAPANRQGSAEVFTEDARNGLQPGAPESFDTAEAEDRDATQRQRAWLTDQQKLQTPGAANPPDTAVKRIDTVLDEPLKREATLQNYLKEVRAWVSAPPGVYEPEPQAPSQGPEIGPSTFVPDRELNSALPPGHGQTANPAVQDLSVSIGTISIVIEEPKNEASLPAPIQPRAERTNEETTRVSTSLSRYYLRSW